MGRWVPFRLELTKKDRQQIEKSVRRNIVPAIGREAVRVLLESHDLKPWRKMWSVAKLDEAYIECLETF